MSEFLNKEKKKEWSSFVKSQNSKLMDKVSELKWMISIKDKSINGLINRNIELENDIKSQQYTINKLKNIIDELKEEVAELSYQLSETDLYC